MSDIRVDSQLAIRLSVGAIRSILKPRYVVKKELRKCLITIELANEHLEKKANNNSILRDTDDQEIKYFMEVRKIGMWAVPWREELKQHSGVPESIVESYMKETAEDIIQNFNNALRNGETQRELVRVIKVITHERIL